MNAPIKHSDNKPALTSASQLSADFGHIEKAIKIALEIAEQTPVVVEDDEDIGICREAVKGLMTEHKRAEALRVETKNPYLDAERVVDSFFNTLKKRLADMQASIEVRAKCYLDKKAAAERARREEEARIAREAERKRQEEAAAADRAAAEERRKAEQAARAAVLADAKEREALEREAARAQAAADAKEVESRAARQKEIDAAAAASQAQKVANEKPADMARTRVASGGMATLQQGFDFEIVDLNAVDFQVLRPHIAMADIEKAIRGYVKIHKDTKPLAGVKIFPTTRAHMR